MDANHHQFFPLNSRDSPLDGVGRPSQPGFSNPLSVSKVFEDCVGSYHHSSSFVLLVTLVPSTVASITSSILIILPSLLAT